MRLAKQNNSASIVVAVLVTLAVAGTGGYMLGKRTGEAAGRLESAVATVNGAAITKNDLFNRLIKQEGAEVLDRMIDEKLVELAAQKANITVTAAEAEAEIKKIQERMGGKEAFEAALKQYNITLEELREDQMFRLRVTKLLAGNLPTDDATLEGWFKLNIDKFDKREVHARHILVDTAEEAQKVRASLDAGTDFAELAKAKSTDPSAQTNGGDLGSNTRGRMVPEFDNVVFNLKPGEISQPFQTQFGWHVAQAIAIKGEAPSFQAVKAEVKEAYVSEAVSEGFQAFITEQREKANIKNTLAQ